MDDRYNDSDRGIDRRKLLKRTGTVGVGLLGGSLVTLAHAPSRI
ncbi:MAG: twin-arginine translocation signal domain-containing protein [Halobacteriales archaeon]|nr:twin-arginine translocation signal domain-containing protein [Halobacteriales archaeon]